MADEGRLAKLQEAFQRFDADGSGFISREEMREAVIKVCEVLGIPQEEAIAEADAMIEESNASGVADDKISFEEFVKLMDKY